MNSNIKLTNRKRAFYNGRIVTINDKSLSDVERKLLFTPMPDYTDGGIVSSGKNYSLSLNSFISFDSFKRDSSNFSILSLIIG